MEISNTESRLAKLADAYMDEVFDRETYFAKKNELVIKRQEMKEKLQSISTKNTDFSTEFGEFLELLKTVYLSYKLGSEREKREMVQITFSNCTAEGKSLIIKLKKPLQVVLEREKFPVGSPQLATDRTLTGLYLKLLQYFKNEAIAKNIEEGLSLSP